MGEIPSDRKNLARTLLMANWTIRQVVERTGLSQQQANGVWTGLKIMGWVPQDARPGKLVQAGPAGWQASGRAGGPVPVVGSDQGLTAGGWAPASAYQQPAVGYQQQAVPSYPPAVNPAQHRPDGREVLAQYLSVEDAEMLVAIWRNPKNRIWYDFFTTKHPEWEGDFADFVSDCVEGFFKTLGWKIVVRKGESRS